jgi:hypothetical protein
VKLSFKPSKQKVTRCRARLRAAGLHPVQIWVPVVDPVKAERQSRLVDAESRFEQAMAWIAQVSTFDVSHDAVR